MYLLTLDINKTALPTDPDTGVTRTLGLRIRPESFPPNVNNDDDNAISVPNQLDGSGASFATVMHNIVPKPQVLTVSAEPVFSDNAGNIHEAPRLTVPVTTLGADTAWPVTSTLGLPDSGYAQVDNEIVSYDSLLGGSPGALINISRGQLGSAAVVHSSGALVGVPVFGWTVDDL